MTTAALTFEAGLRRGQRTEPLRVEIISDAAELPALKEAWDRLAVEANLDHPFVTFDWVSAWWEAFGRGNQLHIVLVRENDVVVGLAPLMFTRRRFYSLPARCLEFIANVHTPRFDLLINTHYPQAVTAILDHVAAIRDQWDIFLLCQVPQDSSTLLQVPEFASRHNLSSASWKSADSPFVHIEGEWRRYFEELRSKHRTNLRRRLRRLSEMGSVDLERISCEQVCESLLTEALRLEGAAWKGGNGTSISSDPSVERFYRLVAERFAANGWLELHFLKIGERRIAVQFAVSYEDKAFSLKPGYDPNYAAHSPSNLLCMLFLEHLFAAGATEYDFLGVEEEWKMQWAQETRAHYWLFVFSGSLVSRLINVAKFRIVPALQEHKARGALRRLPDIKRRLHEQFKKMRVI